eukprot:COSAG06_NODE_4430_length_4274_cov_11.496648_3_plen_123_part_00
MKRSSPVDPPNVESDLDDPQNVESPRTQVLRKLHEAHKRRYDERVSVDACFKTESCSAMLTRIRTSAVFNTLAATGGSAIKVGKMPRSGAFHLMVPSQNCRSILFYCVTLPDQSSRPGSLVS